jgi:hypothetical protein
MSWCTWKSIVSAAGYEEVRRAGKGGIDGPLHVILHHLYLLVLVPLLLMLNHR